jgi:hypothetical protein
MADCLEIRTTDCGSMLVSNGGIQEVADQGKATKILVYHHADTLMNCEPTPTYLTD